MCGICCLKGKYNTRVDTENAENVQVFSSAGFVWGICQYLLQKQGFFVLFFSCFFVSILNSSGHGCVGSVFTSQKVSESFYTMSFEYHRASIRHLGCMNVLAYARIICVPVKMRYRSTETNYQYGYRQMYICMVVC